MYFQHRPPHLQRGYKKPLLYLDFDGVLHPELVLRSRKRGIHLAPGLEHHSLFENVHILVEELRPYPQVLIILSTSWVRVLGFTGAAGYLPMRLKERVVGATFHSAMRKDWFITLPRAQQVMRDVSTREPAAWVAIDDDVADWPEQASANFVASDPVQGLAAEWVRKDLQQKLQAQFGTH